MRKHKQPCDCAWCVSWRERLRKEGEAACLKQAEEWQRIYQATYTFPPIRFLESVIKQAVTLAGNTAAQLADAGHSGKQIAVAILTLADYKQTCEGLENMKTNELTGTKGFNAKYSKSKMPKGWTLMKNKAGRFASQSPSGGLYKDVAPGQSDGGTKAQAIARAVKQHLDDRKFRADVKREYARWKPVKV